MSESTAFDVERFLSLAGSDLIEYAESFIAGHVNAIPVAAYESLRTGLGDMDATHLVYALEICMLLNPSDFLSHVVAFLSHPDVAVCCTAFRIIKGASNTLTSADLMKQIVGTPIVDLYTAHVRTGETIRVGTNEEFIRDLVTFFEGHSA